MRERARELQPDDGRALFRFADARFVAAGGDALRLSVDDRFEPGELVLMYPADRQHERVLLDGATGRMPPASGTVSFLGHDWRELSPERANALRGLIGIVTAEPGWLDHLSVVDNLLLAPLHHTRTPRHALLDEAAAVAERLGLPGLPIGHPDEVAPDDLLRANYVRAFLGTPRLILLECPGRALPDDFRPALINVIREVRERRCTVLWSTLDQKLFYDATLPATRRLLLRGEALVPLRSVS